MLRRLYASSRLSTYGWGSAHTAGFGVSSIALMAGFLARQATARTRCCRCVLLRSRNVSGANLVQAFMVQGLFGMFFLGALFMQRVLNYRPTQVGLAFLPVAGAIGVLSLGVSAKLTTKVGARAGC